jgi:hypothetical protein
VHGGPVLGQDPAIILIRSPHPTIYSWYHTATERWAAQINDVPAWIRDAYAGYERFYDTAFALQRQSPDRVHLIRFEELKEDVASLRRVVDFIGVRPKLSPEFVFEWTRFDRMTKGGRRTFYRTGDNATWRSDPAWREHLKEVPLAIFPASDTPTTHDLATRFRPRSGGSPCAGRVVFASGPLLVRRASPGGQSLQ